MEVAHRSTNSQRPASRLQTKLQTAEKLISPGSILFAHRSKPAALGPTHVRTVSQDMDKRHPSSFQQLEKVPCPRPSCSNIVCDRADLDSSVKELMLRYTCTSIFQSHMTDGTGLQRPKPPEWRTGRTQRNPSRLRRRNAIDRHTRNLLDERIEA